MRCPECRHRAQPSRWWRLPETLTCYQCGARLARASRFTFGEAMATWLLVMLPGTVIAWFGGIGGFVLGSLLALVILPVRPWRGLRYELAEGESAGLPVARSLAPPPPQDPTT